MEFVKTFYYTFLKPGNLNRTAACKIVNVSVNILKVIINVAIKNLSRICLQRKSRYQRKNDKYQGETIARVN